MRNAINRTLSITFILLILFSVSNSVLALSKDSIILSQDAPIFTLEGYSNKSESVLEWSLKENRGKWIVLYFYPKDFTSGCTIEAKGFQKLNSEFKRLNSNIVGISTDKLDIHKDFCSNKNLEFTLLTDQGGEVSKKYDSWNKTTSSRNTFLIDPSGKVSYKWIGANPVIHPADVLDKLKDLST